MVWGSGGATGQRAVVVSGCAYTHVRLCASDSTYSPPPCAPCHVFLSPVHAGVALRSLDIPLDTTLNETSLLGPTLEITRSGCVPVGCAAAYLRSRPQHECAFSAQSPALHIAVLALRHAL